MGYTISEKILLKHINKKAVASGEFIMAGVDLCLGNDITAPLAIKEAQKYGLKKVFDNKRIALIPDHFTPNKDVNSANQCKLVRDFAKKYGIEHYYEVGKMGIEHALLPEMGLVMPGDLVVGADSHTCTYGALGAFSTGVGSTDLAGVFLTGKVWLRVPDSIKFIFKGKRRKWVGGKDLILYAIKNIGVDGANYKAMEFCGEAIDDLPMDDRFTMCNMAIEAGGKSGIVNPDEITFEYIKEAVSSSGYRGLRKKPKKGDYRIWAALQSDKDAKYVNTYEYDISKLEPQVALPHLPSNVKPVSEIKNLNIDQAVIGSCTNGRISDLRIAAGVLKGKKVNSRVRLIVIPATQKIYLQALKEGLIEIFVNAGGVFSTPTCGPCLGGHMGILTKGERAIATTNRNFIGRMGHPESEVCLSSPAVAAASAIKGRIAHPNEVA